MAPKGKERPEFEAVSSKEEARSLLTEAAQTNASVIVWASGQEEGFKGEIRSFEPATGILVVHSRTPEKIQSLSSPECYFSVSLVRANVFFRTRYLASLTEGLRFKEPDNVFKVQRRQDVRLRIPPGMVLDATFQDPSIRSQIIRRRIFDIGAGGIALAIAEKDHPLWNPGDRVRKLSFSLGGQNVECEALVKSVRPVGPDAEPGREYIVGLVFDKIPPGKAQIIAGFVFAELRKLFSRVI